MLFFGKNYKHKAFSLNELIVVMVVIGTVIALAGPTLYKTYKSKTYELGRNVLIGSLRSSMRTMQANEGNIKYATTEDFVKVLSKYMKISQICDSYHLYNCFPQYFIEGDGTIACNETSSGSGSGSGGCSYNDYNLNEAENINNYRTSAAFGKSYDTENVGVIFANGIHAVLTYDPFCKETVGQTKDSESLPCLGVLYDVNGRKKPNNTLSDIGFINAGLTECKDGIKIGSKCWYLDDIQEGITDQTTKTVDGVDRYLPSYQQLSELFQSTKFYANHEFEDGACYQTNSRTSYTYSTNYYYCLKESQSYNSNFYQTYCDRYCTKIYNVYFSN